MSSDPSLSGQIFVVENGVASNVKKGGVWVRNAAGDSVLHPFETLRKLSPLELLALEAEDGKGRPH